jgi:hypothetical protein
MEILKEFKNAHEGNDCLITEYISLIKLDQNLFIVTFTEDIFGSWTGSPKTSNVDTFINYYKALNFMNFLIKKVIRR